MPASKEVPFIIPIEHSSSYYDKYRNEGENLFKRQVDLMRMQQLAANRLWNSSSPLKGKRIKVAADASKKAADNSFFSNVKQFCATTSLHGWHFIVEQDKTFLERSFWILALCVVYTCCALFIKQSIHNWIDSPPVISMENAPTSVGTIPFPAITICSSSQIKPSVFNLSAYFLLSEEEKRNLSESFYAKLDYASAVCNLELRASEKDFLDLDAFQFMLHNAAFSCEDIFVAIKWTNETLDNPCDYIQTIITDLGVCYSFNMLPLKILFSEYYLDVIRIYKHYQMGGVNGWAKLSEAHWTPDTDYDGRAISATDVPRRIAGVGTSHAVTMVLNLADDFDKHCNAGGRGFMVLVHNPAQIPTSANAKLGITHSSLDWLLLNPKRLRTSADIKDWSPSRRGCYFDHERSLHFFDIYTQSNCDLECESNYSLSICGCVPYYHPRALFTPICSYRKMSDCVEDALTTFVRMYAVHQIGCDCLPSCSLLEYESDVMSIDVLSTFSADEIDLNESLAASDLSSVSKDKRKQHSTVVITYQAKDIIGTIRRSLYGFSDFLGTVGGIMGLFLGFSWISLLEVIYFVSFRPRRREIHRGND